NEFNDITRAIQTIPNFRYVTGFPLESITIQGIPFDDDVREDILRLGKQIPGLKIGGFGQESDRYGDSNNASPDETSPSETSSEGEWASGDEEVVLAHWKARDFILCPFIANHLILTLKYGESTQILEYIFESTEGSQDED
ncbi:hypothetical protein FRC01_008977, partial [Tulasnella sp. 417]